MARGSRGGNNRRRVEKREEDSEDSDEEYKVTEDEESDESDECYSFDGEESEEDILDDFEVSRRAVRSRNTRRTSSGRKGNRTVKPRKKRRIAYKEDDDDDDYDEEEEGEEVGDAGFVSSGRKVNLVKKPTEKKRVSYIEADNDDEEELEEEEGEEEEEDEHAEFVSAGRKRSRRNAREKKRIVYTEDDDEEEKDGDEDDAEFMCLGKKRNHRKNPQEKKTAVYTDNDDRDDYEDDVEFVCPRRKRNHRKNPREKKVLYTEDDEEDDKGGAEFMSLGSKGNHITNAPEKNIVYADDDDDEDDVEFMPSGIQRDVYAEDDDEDAAEFISSGSTRNHIKNLPENKRVVYSEDEEEEVEVEEDADDDDAEFMYTGRKADLKKNLRKKRKVSYMEDDDDEDSELMTTIDKENQMQEPGEQMMVSYKEENQEDADEKDAEFRLTESDYVDDEDDSEFVSTSRNGNRIPEPIVTQMVSDNEDYQEEEEDEKDAEFKLSESDFVDDEDETPKMKKNEKISRSYPQKKNVRRGQKKSKKSKIKKPTKSKQSNYLENKQAENKRRTQRVMAGSDSDFVSSASSDHEYTISEEEREQIREAVVYCPTLRPKLRSSSNGMQEEQPAHEQRYPKRKGKEKVEDMKDEVGKQVCGICLSEEAKRTVRGVLNCCRHYFCFSCIMEWSKVESRCPLCKQRFATITKAAKSDTGFDLRTVVISVPECDQVYQPSEEELRGYLDPYESVRCTECQNGGDDALMLLCDICDSSAHTYCVGLGREVPEGNWYCEGCRPTVFGTLSSQRPTPPSDRRLSGNASDLSSPIAGGFDLNEMYVPETPLIQQTYVLPEPMPAPTGTAATTLRDRRRIHRHIQDRILNNNRMSDLVARSSGTSAASSSSGIRLFGSQLDQTRVSTPQNAHIMPSMHDTSIISPRMDQFGVQLQSSNFATMDMSLQDEHGGSGMGFESRLGFPQLHPCTNRSSIGSDPCPSPYACRDVIGPSRTSQGGLQAP
uniref:uncharacterized protein LOC122590910 n=1 Tax=Erigeron canadensis TaxID=72917 RepID=UPI001CB9C9FC|nr:uncharacterized protein LOC122590910 [Erigeron canadensis]